MTSISTVDTHYVRDKVAASHLVIDNGRAAFIDCGTASSVGALLNALAAAGLGPEAVDWICPTHVHLDHAGGAGQLMLACPNATCVVHPRGARHLIDPAKLVAGSIAVYGEAAFRAMYDEIQPIAEERVLIAEDGLRLPLGGSELEFIHTEGHARHHYCVIHRAESAIFSGDTLGIAYPCFATSKGAFVFATTTPVQFDPDAWLESLDRIETSGVTRGFLTHFGEVTDLGSLFTQLRGSIGESAQLARRFADGSDRTAKLQAELFDLLCRRLDDHGDRRSVEERHALLDMDVELNVMGLEVWLDRQS